MTRPVITQLPADLREAFERLVADADGPFGPTPLTRLMSAHRALFAELRLRGASWAQIAALLSGIIGNDGAFTADVVRATYARVAKAAATPGRKRTGHNATKGNEGDRNAVERGVTQRNTAKRNEARPDDEPTDGAATAIAQLSVVWPFAAPIDALVFLGGVVSYAVPWTDIRDNKVPAPLARLPARAFDGAVRCSAALCSAAPGRTAPPLPLGGCARTGA